MVREFNLHFFRMNFRHRLNTAETRIFYPRFNRVSSVAN
jgi:hypothetical protein